MDLCAGGLKMYDGGLEFGVIELDLDTTLQPYYYYYYSCYYYYCYYHYYRHEF